MREIPLRQADRLQKAINEAVSGQPIATEVTVDIFAPDWQAKVEKCRLDAMAALDRNLRLIRLVAEIRARVSAANATTGISALLAEKAALERIKAIYELMASADESDTGSALRRIENSRKRFDTAPNVAVRDTLGLSALTAEDLAGAKANVRRTQLALEKISNKLLQLNAGNSIILTDEEESLLVGESLLDEE